MHLVSCFINKNTPEIRKELERLGYEKISSTQGNSIFISNSKYMCFDLSGKDKLSFDSECVDCTDNEPLFFALAALRDDTDKDQLFVADANISYHLAFPNGDPFFGDINKGDFFIMDKAMMHADILGEESFIQDLSHKLDKDELIKHFTKGEER